MLFHVKNIVITLVDGLKAMEKVYAVKKVKDLAQSLKLMESAIALKLAEISHFYATQVPFFICGDDRNAPGRYY